MSEIVEEKRAGLWILEHVSHQLSDVAENVKRLEDLVRDYGHLLATLSLEQNRESIRKGEGLNQLFDIIDQHRERYNEPWPQ